MSSARDQIRGSNLDVLRKRLQEVARLVEKEPRVFDKSRKSTPASASYIPAKPFKPGKR